MHGLYAELAGLCGSRPAALPQRRQLKRHQLAGLRQQRHLHGGFLRPQIRPWTLSAFFAAHVLTFNWNYDLPGHGLLLGGWQLNKITTLQIGHPFEIVEGFNRSGNLNTTSFSRHDRPNLKAGYSHNPVLGRPDRYWNVEAFELQPINARGNPRHHLTSNPVGP